jgi:uroporphyrinogen-III synthase
VLVTREPGRPGALALALVARGFDPIVAPAIELRPALPGGPLDEAAGNLTRYAWIVVTSAAGAESLADAAERVGASLAGARLAAVGAGTADALLARSGRAAFAPSRATGAALAAELPLAPGDRVLLARADAADAGLPAGLRARGAVVDEVVAYHTIEAPEASRQPARDAIRSGVAAITFASGSAVRGLLALLPPAERHVARRTPACCIGPTTAAAAREAGFERVLEAEAASVDALAELVPTSHAGTPGRPLEVPR